MRQLRWVLAGGGSALTLALLSAGSASADHGRNFWAGQWTTNTGGVAFRLMDASEIANAKQERRAPELFNKLPCKTGPQFYRGGYGSGKVIACGTRTKVSGRWLSNSKPNDKGSFTIKIIDTDPLKFSGTAKPDGGAGFPYTGTWKMHFDGDRCCLAPKNPKPPACRTLNAVLGPVGGTDGCLRVTYEMPERFGLDNDHDDLVDYPSPDKAPLISPKGWRVEFKVAPIGESCNILNQDTVVWTVDGAVKKFRTTGRCQYQFRFADEGVYTVGLTVKDYRSKVRKLSLKVNVQDFVIVGIGDSLSSGEGSPDEPTRAGQAVRWQSRRCHASARSWQALVAKEMEDEDEQSSVTFIHLACSGASIEEGLLAPYEGIEDTAGDRLPGQVLRARALLAKREIDAVLMTIGVNDFGFAQIVKFCVIRPDCENRDYPGLSSGESLNAFTVRRLGELPARFRLLANAFRNIGVRPARVFPSHYPNILSEPGGGLCDEVVDDAVPLVPGVDISRNESVWLFNSLLVPLNSAISDAARDNGWTVTPGAREAFAGRGYCAPAADRWVVTKVESVANQGNDAGTLHPNPAGHQAMGAVAIRFIKGAFFPNGQARAAD